MKDYRNNEMKWLAVLYTALLLYFCTNFFNIINAYTENDIPIWAKTVESVFTTSMIPLFVYIADSCVPTKMKNWLLGSCIVKPYGNTVFSKISSGKFNDERIDCETVKLFCSNIIKKMPTDKRAKFAYENKEWNVLYATVEENGAVKQTQKDWLAFRDLYCETILFTLIYLISIFMFDTIFFSTKLLLILIVMSAILNICAHIKMKRFVYTVIVKAVLVNKTKTK